MASLSYFTLWSDYEWSAESVGFTVISPDYKMNPKRLADELALRLERNFKVEAQFTRDAPRRLYIYWNKTDRYHTDQVEAGHVLAAITEMEEQIKKVLDIKRIEGLLETEAEEVVDDGDQA